MDGFISVDNFSAPQILVVERDFLLLYKPPRMHSVSLARPEGKQSLIGDTTHKHGINERTINESLVDWCIREFPELAQLSGRRVGEGGLLHRLDYETQGLLLFARTQPVMESFLYQQKEGKMIKDYSALTGKCKTILPGFPEEKPELPPGFFSDVGWKGNVQIKSAFRPYGPGRKAVRPVLGEQYITEIIERRLSVSEFDSFHLRIFRGFRHQIRNHLAWMGHPILNDALYGGPSYGKGFLGLRAYSLTFTDPSSDRELTYSIPPLHFDEL